MNHNEMFLPYKPNVKNEKYAHMHSYCINHVSITTLEQFTIIRVSRKWRITAKVLMILLRIRRSTTTRL